MTCYLSVADLIQINERMTARWADILEEAASLCESPLQNHPFIDGNKRSAVVATAVFLRWNGYKLQFLDREMYDWRMSLYASGSVDRRALDTWLRAHVVES